MYINLLYELKKDVIFIKALHNKSQEHTWIHVSRSADPLHPPAFPHTTSSAFPNQAEWQAYQELREKQLHNEGFMTLFYKALLWE